MPNKPSAKRGQKAIAAKRPKVAAKTIVPVADAPSETASDIPNVTPAAERGAQLKLRDLIARVAEATGGKKKDQREVIEATLAALGAALTKGEELNLPGIGRVRVARSADRDGRSNMVLKVRGVGAAAKKKDAKEDLAEIEEAV